MGAVETTKDQGYGVQSGMVLSLILSDSDARISSALDLYWWRYWGLSGGSLRITTLEERNGRCGNHQGLGLWRSEYNGFVAYIVRF